MTTAPTATKQVITILPNGSIEGLAIKGKALNLRQFGHAKIERTSEILWNEKAQAWTIQFLHGSLAKRFAGFRHLPLLGVEKPDAERIVATLSADCVASFNRMTFPDYDDAVRAEVIMIQAARLSGNGSMIAP